MEDQVNERVTASGDDATQSTNTPSFQRTSTPDDDRELKDRLMREEIDRQREQGIPSTEITSMPEGGIISCDDDGLPTAILSSEFTPSATHTDAFARAGDEPYHGSYLEMIRKGENIKVFSSVKPVDQKNTIIDYFITVNDAKPIIFRQGTQPMHIFSSGEKVTIMPVSRKAIVTQMYGCVDYMRVNRDGTPKAAFFPQPLVDMITTDLELTRHLPEIVGVENRPYILDDGTIITKNGYNLNTKTYLNNVNKIKGSDLIWFKSHDEAVEAFNELIEPLSEFGYHNGIYHQNTIAMLFSIEMRTIIDAPIPIFMITKPHKSFGGTLLLETMFHYFKEPYNSKPFPYTSKDCTEVFSNCDSLVIRGFDDLPDKLSISHQVQQALTSGTYSYTPKYSNDERTVKLSAVMIGTGKQVKTGTEQAKRSVEIHLSKKDIGKPRTREGNDTQLEFVDTNQRRYEILMLSLVRYWIINGSPKASDKIPLKTSFDRWRSVIGGLLEFYGFGDLFLQEDKTREIGLDEESVIEMELLEDLYSVMDGKEFVAANYINIAKNNMVSMDILARLIPSSRGERSDITRLGNKLASLANRSDVDGEFQIIRSSSRRHSTYQVIKTMSTV